VLNIDVGLRSAGRPISALRSSWNPRCASQISESESSSESCINDTASGSYDSARASAFWYVEGPSVVAPLGLVREQVFDLV
jgi:hypothetical protein